MITRKETFTPQSIRPFAAALLLLCLLVLCGCGFRPLYGSAAQPEERSGSALLSRIEIVAIPERSGQDLRNRLIDRFYPQGGPADPLYRLQISSLSESLRDLDITKSSDATRAQLRLNATMTLRDIRTGDVVLTRSLSATSSYNILKSQFTTRVAEDYARNNALEDLARQVEAQIVLFFAR